MKERLKAWGDTKVIAIVGAFAFNEYGELLLLQRHSEDLGGGQWGTPGGRIDDGESAKDAMVREFYEETGIKERGFDLLGVHEIRMPHGTVKMTSYKTNVSKNVQIVLDPNEHHAFAWFNLKSLLDEDNILWGILSRTPFFGHLCLCPRLQLALPV
jgi:mutator protein MutT